VFFLQAGTTQDAVMRRLAGRRHDHHSGSVKAHLALGHIDMRNVSASLPRSSRNSSKAAVLRPFLRLPRQGRVAFEDPFRTERAVRAH
jgi:hypothetical protein